MADGGSQNGYTKAIQRHINASSQSPASTSKPVLLGGAKPKPTGNGTPGGGKGKKPRQDVS